MKYGVYFALLLALLVFFTLYLAKKHTQDLGERCSWREHIKAGWIGMRRLSD